MARTAAVPMCARRSSPNSPSRRLALTLPEELWRSLACRSSRYIVSKSVARLPLRWAHFAPAPNLASEPCVATKSKPDAGCAHPRRSSGTAVSPSPTPAAIRCAQTRAVREGKISRSTATTWITHASTAPTSMMLLARANAGGEPAITASPCLPGASRRAAMPNRPRRHVGRRDRHARLSRREGCGVRFEDFAVKSGDCCSVALEGQGFDDDADLEAPRIPEQRQGRRHGPERTRPRPGCRRPGAGSGRAIILAPRCRSSVGADGGKPSARLLTYRAAAAKGRRQR